MCRWNHSTGDGYRSGSIVRWDNGFAQITFPVGKVAFFTKFAVSAFEVVADFGFDSWGRSVVGMWWRSRGEVPCLGDSVVATRNIVEEVAILTKGTTSHAAENKM